MVQEPTCGHQFIEKVHEDYDRKCWYKWGKTTNHSARKTMITKLVENDTNPLHVAQLTGHKNIKSLDSHSIASKKQQRDMSHLISGVPAVKDITNTRTVCSNPSYPGVPLPSCSAGMTIANWKQCGEHILQPAVAIITHLQQITSKETTSHFLG